MSVVLLEGEGSTASISVIRFDPTFLPSVNWKKREKMEKRGKKKREK